MYLERKKLRDFFGDGTAPDGLVYIVDGQPLVQVQILPLFYSLYWVGTAEPLFLQYKFVAALEEIEPKSLGLRRLPDLFGTAAAVVAVTKGKWATVQKALKLPGDKPASIVQEQILDMLGPIGAASQEVAAVRCHLGSIGRPGLYLALWAHTDISPESEKITGVAANLPLSRPMQDFLRQSSPELSTLNDSDFSEVTDAVKDDLSWWRYFP